MFQYLAFSEELTRLHVEELLHEAERDRLALQALPAGQPVRARIAGWLRGGSGWHGGGLLARFLVGALHRRSGNLVGRLADGHVSGLLPDSVDIRQDFGV
jgi:hypothetical protein